MRKKLLLALAIATAIVSIILISLEIYYVTIALVVGALLMGHREIWSLIRRRRLPVFDERAAENVNKSVRNGFIFLVMVIAFLMLPFGIGLIEGVDILNVLGGLFISAGALYMLSYFYYDRAAPRFSEKWRILLRVFLYAAVISLGVFIISVFLHNAVYGLFEVWFGEGFWERVGVSDEPVFFFVALLSVAALAASIVGSLVVFIIGLAKKS